MLSLLLDENISPVIAGQIAAKRPDVLVIALSQWQAGRLLSEPDERILTEAAAEGRTLVTYDRKTIVPLLVRLTQAGKSHAGVVFVDHHSIPSNDFGQLVRSLIALWDASHADTWTNRVEYLRAVLVN
ncbi:MAG: DUF5615 family PIN-like protein [Capsulimonadaceae bacterium]